MRVIHLVRDGRDVLQSYVQKGSNWAAEGYREEKPLRVERSLIGWNLANGLAWALGTTLREDRYLRVHFENLLDHPESVLHEIGSFVGEDLSSIIDRVRMDESFPVGHNVGGNRLRHKERVCLRRRKEESHRPGEELSRYQRGLFALLGCWLNRGLGYT